MLEGDNYALRLWGAAFQISNKSDKPDSGYLLSNTSDRNMSAELPLFHLIFLAAVCFPGTDLIESC